MADCITQLPKMKYVRKLERINLKELYIEKKLSTRAIAKLVGSDSSNVYRELLRQGICVRKRGGKEMREVMSRKMSGKYKGANNPFWKGGKYKELRGYIFVYSPQHPHRNKHNTVYEHRLVMEKYMERYLDPKEVVHHIDHNKSNNSLNNLHLFSSKSIHLKYHCFLRKTVKEEIQNVART